MLQLERPDTLVDRVVSSIRSEIRAGRLAASSRLPTEHQLAEQLSVSRSVIREAVAQLKADGVLVSRRGDGSYISQTPAGQVFRLPGARGGVPDLVQMFEMRLWIESQAAAVAAARRRPADLQRMRRAIKVMDDNADDFAVSSAADVEFHRAIAAACRNDYFTAFHDFLGGQLAQARLAAWENSARLSGGARSAQAEHRALYAAIADADSARAGDCARVHLQASALRLGIALPQTG